MKNLAIIPARSGSKGLKNKNIKLLNGKPLLAYSIEAALKSKCFDSIIVSTDSKKYADIAIKYGAQVPFFRSTETSTDTATSWDVVREVLKDYKKLGIEFDNFMLLQPTSPLRTEKDIKNAFKLLERKKANSVVSVCEAETNPENCLTISDNLYMSNILKKRNNTIRRQDANKYYRFNGAIYLSRVNNLIKNGNIYNSKCYAYIMNKRNSVDIDDEIDFRVAEILIRDLNK